jgi:hypothetical protein
MKKISAIFLTLVWVTILSACTQSDKIKPTEWKTYASTAYWYEFQYPSEWKFKHDTLDIDPNYHNAIIDIWSSGKPIGDFQVLNGWHETLDDDSQYNMENYLKILRSNKYSPLLLNGASWFYLEDKTPKPWISRGTTLESYIIKDEEIFLILYTINRPEVNERLGSKSDQDTPKMSLEEHEKLFKQIIETFKFIN